MKGETYMFAVSVDIGGTQTRVACIDDKGLIINKQAFRTYVDDPIRNIKEVKKIILSFEKEIIGVGISCPGPLDLLEGTVLTPPNLPGWHYFSLRSKSEEILSLPVFLENDANLAALAESQIGAGKNNNIVQYLTISTGVGGGLIINNEIFTGAHGFAQEIANSILWKDGPKQGLLKKGSLESISSGTAIFNRAKALGLDVRHVGHVNALALLGDTDAIMIMEQAKDYLANMLAIMIGVIDPDIIVLGGGVVINTANFIEDIEKRVKDKVYDVLRDKIKIKKAALGDDSGLIGGALHAFSKLKER